MKDTTTEVTMKNKRSYTKFTIFLFLLIIFADCQNAAAQEKDPAKANKDSISPDAHLYHAEIHVGIGTQKAVFGGYRLVIDPLFFEMDIGREFYGTDKNFTFSAHLGYAPPAARTQPGFVYSVIFTNYWKEFFSTSTQTSYTLFTANIGWLSQHGIGFTYALNAGAGIKMTNSEVNPGEGKTLHEPRFFFNLEGSVGFTFF